MGESEHFMILKEGVNTWNEWRTVNPYLSPTLAKADLADWDLSAANLRGVQFHLANLKGANLLNTDLRQAQFSRTALEKANLISANCQEASLYHADLREADLSAADIRRSKFTGTNLTGAKWEGTALGETVFLACNLSDASGVDTCRHFAESSIDHATIMQSPGISRNFLRGLGFPDNLINFYPSLRANRAQFYSVFLSYSNRDEEFARLLHTDLQDNGVRCWFAPEDLTVGDKIIDAIDRSIRTYDKLIVILSDNSIKSTWIEDEVNAAIRQEQIRRGSVLFPVRLDESVFDTNELWVKELRNRNIADFTNWRQRHNYRNALRKLLRDLSLSLAAEPTGFTS